MNITNTTSTSGHSQEEFTKTFGQLSLSETDDDNMTKSIQSSPIQDERVNELLWKLPVLVRQIFNSLGPLQKLEFQVQLVNQNDDSTYLGQILANQKQGHGFQIWIKQGNFLEGNWENDILHGFTRMIYSNGDIFECEFSSGKANGFGVFKSSKKMVKGIWNNNMLEGEGQELRFDGSRYFGQFLNGKKTGRCLIYFKDGCKYEGQVRNGKLEGKGIMMWNDGTYYVGEFKCGLICGIGGYFYGQGEQFAGFFNEIPQKSKENISGSNNKQSVVFTNEYNQTMLIEKNRIL